MSHTVLLAGECDSLQLELIDLPPPIRLEFVNSNPRMTKLAGNRLIGMIRAHIRWIQHRNGTFIVIRESIT